MRGKYNNHKYRVDKNHLMYRLDKKTAQNK